MSDSQDAEFFKLRKESKTYISKVFTFGGRNVERLRRVWMVMDGSDRLHLGKIDGALCLRLSGKIRRTQVTALITQDENNVKRLTLQTFKTRAGDWVEALEKDEFTFRQDEFERLLGFLSQLQFIDLSNEANFHIEDISKRAGPKAIIDASDRSILEQITGMHDDHRQTLLKALRDDLTRDDINILLGRKDALKKFEEKIADCTWCEAQWQDFFEREQWVFGYGLEYRIMRQFDREMSMAGSGTDNRERDRLSISS